MAEVGLVGRGGGAWPACFLRWGFDLVLLIDREASLEGRVGSVGDRGEVGGEGSVNVLTSGDFAGLGGRF